MCFNYKLSSIDCKTICNFEDHFSEKKRKSKNHKTKKTEKLPKVKTEEKKQPKKLAKEDFQPMSHENKAKFSVMASAKSFRPTVWFLFVKT